MAKFSTAFALTLASLCSAGNIQLGKPLSLKTQTPIASLSAKPANYLEKTIQVKGRVAEVCEKAGCWMNLIDPASNARVRIKVNDGEIVFPKEAIGTMAVAEGKFVKIELTQEQAIERARHEAEENKKPFKASSVKGPVTLYQIQGECVVIE